MRCKDLETCEQLLSSAKYAKDTKSETKTPTEPKPTNKSSTETQTRKPTNNTIWTKTNEHDVYNKPDNLLEGSIEDITTSSWSRCTMKTLIRNKTCTQCYMIKLNVEGAQRGPNGMPASPTPTHLTSPETFVNTYTNNIKKCHREKGNRQWKGDPSMKREPSMKGDPSMMSAITTFFRISVCFKAAQIDHMSIFMFLYSNILNTQTRPK